MTLTLGLRLYLSLWAVRELRGPASQLCCRAAGGGGKVVKCSNLEEALWTHFIASIFACIRSQERSHKERAGGRGCAG